MASDAIVEALKAARDKGFRKDTTTSFQKPDAAVATPTFTGTKTGAELGSAIRPDITIGRDLGAMNFNAQGQAVKGPGDTDVMIAGIPMVRHSDGSVTDLKSFNMPPVTGDSEGMLHPKYKNSPGGF